LPKKAKNGMNKQKDTGQGELPPPPREPLPEECCGRGCERCVYVFYEEALQRWQDKIAKIRSERDLE
jgi:hypothetical protein